VSRIRPATSAEVPALADLLAGIFRDDPMAAFPIPPSDAEPALRRFFAIYDGLAADEGWLWTIDADAAALWFPPGSTDAYRRMTELATAAMGEQPAGSEGVADGFWSWIDEHHPLEPHWYLDHVAVAEARRGEGLGSALIDHGLASAKADATPAFLITDRPANVPYYERRGFRVDASGVSPVGGPFLWFMRADPSRDD
jgi:GNAT superfamily N-acetyltransferase